MMNWKNWTDELSKKGIYGGGDRVIGGYIKIKADNLQQAIEISKGCPIFNFDGNIEIREVAKQ
jgi:hypothetical protein